METSYYLLFDRVEIQNANAVSSPITYGFPAVSGFVGAIHALSRAIPAEDDIRLNGVMIACHSCDVQAYRPHAFADYSFNQSRSPIKKDGKTASIIEEGKVHLEVSLVVEVCTQQRQTLNDEAEHPAFLRSMRQRLMQQRIAGGSVMNVNSVRLFNTEQSEDIARALLPAFVLIEAQQELADITRDLQHSQSEPTFVADATPLNALIETAVLRHIAQENGEWSSQSVKSGRGWLVPIPVGYQGISAEFAPGEMVNCRTVDYPSQYVECLYSLGKWVFPYRLKERFSDGFWRYQHPQRDIYLVTQATY